MKILSDWQWVIIFIGLVYYVIKHSKDQKCINTKVKRAYMCININTIFMGLLMIGYFAHFIPNSSIFGILLLITILINCAILIFIIYQHYLSETDKNNKEVRKKDMRTFIWCFCVVLLMLLYKLFK